MLPIPAKEYMQGENVLDKEWDILIILDACRYDTFTQIKHENEKEPVNPINLIISLASSTGEWFYKTFNNKQCKNIIYVSANPWISELAITEIPGQQNIGYNPFYKLINTNSDVSLTKLESFLPSKISKISSKMVMLHPDKKIIVHYMQPHYPYLGNKKIYQALWEPLRKEMFRLDKTIAGEEFRLKDYKPEQSIWNVMKEGILTREEVYEAYKDNLRYVLKEMPIWQEWAKSGKKVIITADHGECFLDYGIDGHPSGMRIEQLVKVPFYEVK